MALREAFGGGFARDDRKDAESDESDTEEPNESADATAESDPTPGADGTASDETVATVFSMAPALNERIYAMEWDNGRLILDVANVAEAQDYCEDIKAATGARAISARQGVNQTRLC